MGPCLPQGRISITCAILVSSNHWNYKYILMLLEINSVCQKLITGPYDQWQQSFHWLLLHSENLWYAKTLAQTYIIMPYNHIPVTLTFAQNQSIPVMLPASAINSSLSSAVKMRQSIGSALVQIMACHLFRAKPLSKPMQCHCQLHCQEQISVKFDSELYHINSRKCISKRRYVTVAAILSRGRWVSSQFI